MKLLRAFPTGENLKNLLIPSAYVAPAALRSGNPSEHAYEHATSEDGLLTVGAWTAEPYAEQISSFDGYEITHLLEGCIELTAEDGAVSTFRAGDTFTMEPGWAGEYRVVETVVKHFTFYVPKG